MTVNPIRIEETVFHAARGIRSPEERAAYLVQACGQDRALRARVDALLKIYLTEHSSDGFIQGTGSALFEQLAQSAQSPVEQQLGTVVGRYKLLERLGEGGFGIVYMAEQQHPVRRKVAVKVIKPGLDTKQVIARFEAERQALAMMDHENIAKVLDAGANEAGRPYFVMELVYGVPITQYCDDNKLTPRDRLELFVKVCRAVQHAHSKGIIHRDIKPTNVLVTLRDGLAVPKVIDFGVAKATGQRPRTDQTLFTQFAQIVGTPLYMSPEQAEMSGLDVDTRSDVYSLGVLLYELLTGTTPFDKDRLKQAAADEVRRIIREEQPPKPSTRLSTVAGLTNIAARHGLEPKKLVGIIRGELDWIAMQALEKDRRRRYETANGLARDVDRYLRNEVVEASPPSATYRLVKFVGRNRAALAAGGIVGLATLIALGGIAAGIGLSARDRAARQARVSAQLELILEEVSKLEFAEKWSQALTSARRAEPALATGDAAPDIQARTSQALADLEFVQRLEDARSSSGTAWGDPRPVAQATHTDRQYREAFSQAGIDFDTLPVEENAERIRVRKPVAAALLPALDDWIALRTRSMKGVTARPLIEVQQIADSDPWRQGLRDALSRQNWTAVEMLARSADLDRQPAATLSFLAAACRANGKWQEEIVVLRRAQWKYPSDFWINHRLGISLIGIRSPHEIEEGIGYMRAAVALRPDNSHAIMNLGNGYFELGRWDEAISCYRQAIELFPSYNGNYNNLGEALAHKEMHAEAIAAHEQAIRLSPSNADGYANLAMVLSDCPDPRIRDHRRAAALAEKAVQLEPGSGNFWTALGVARYRLGQWCEACEDLEKSLQLGTGGSGHRWPDAIDWFFLSMSHSQMGQMDDARRCYERATAWIEKNKQFEDKRLRRLRAEADNLLTGRRQ